MATAITVFAEKSTTGAVPPAFGSGASEAQNFVHVVASVMTARAVR